MEEIKNLVDLCFDKTGNMFNSKDEMIQYIDDCFIQETMTLESDDYTIAFTQNLDDCKEISGSLLLFSHLEVETLRDTLLKYIDSGLSPLICFKKNKASSNRCIFKSKIIIYGTNQEDIKKIFKALVDDGIIHKNGERLPNVKYHCMDEKDVFLNDILAV